MLYAGRADVLRALGGTATQLERAFGRQLWGSTPATAVVVDTASIDVPDVLLARIDYQLEAANSRVDGYVLQAYQARPTNVPAHLRDATARLAAYSALMTDGQRTDFVRAELDRAEGFMKQLAAGKVDLGIEAPRPLMRRPAAVFVASRRSYGGGH